jgi:hypothetical protein
MADLLLPAAGSQYLREECFMVEENVLLGESSTR